MLSQNCCFRVLILLLRASFKQGFWSPGLLLPLATGVCLPNGIAASERKLLAFRLQEQC